MYAGGSFNAVGDLTTNYIAKWDGTTSSWRALANGVNDTVYALAVDGTGSVYAGGSFTTASGVAANHIAVWDGTRWNALGGGMDRSVLALGADGAYTVYAGGDFTIVEGIAANNIAKWDGATSSWSVLGSGLDGRVKVLTADGRGKLLRWSPLRYGYSRPYYYVAMREGTGWRTLGSGNNEILALAADGRGNLYAGAISPTPAACPSTTSPAGMARRGTPWATEWTVASVPWQWTGTTTSMPGAASPPPEG